MAVIGSAMMTTLKADLRLTKPTPFIKATTVRALVSLCKFYRHSFSLLSIEFIDILLFPNRPDPTMTVTQERELAPQLKLRSLLETIALSIGRSTKVVEIECFPNDALFTFAVDPHDQGRLIGKMGNTIWGIQTIFWYAGLTQFGWSYSVKLIEPDVPVKNRRPIPFRLNPKWDRKKIENLVREICDTCLRSYCQWSLEETGEARLTINLKLMRYLKINLTDPSFTEAFEAVLWAAGMSNGVQIKTEVSWE